MWVPIWQALTTQFYPSLLNLLLILCCMALRVLIPYSCDAPKTDVTHNRPLGALRFVAINVKALATSSLNWLNCMLFAKRPTEWNGNVSYLFDQTINDLAKMLWSASSIWNMNHGYWANAHMILSPFRRTRTPIDSIHFNLCRIDIDIFQYNRIVDIRTICWLQPLPSNEFCIRVVVVKSAQIHRFI